MSLIQSVRQSVSNFFRTVRRSLTLTPIGTTEVYAEVNSQKAIDNGFNSNTAVYSIVMRDAEKFGSIPRYLYDAKVSEEKAYDDNLFDHKELVNLLNRPNDFQSQDAFFTAVRAYFKICGEAFIWLNRGLDPQDSKDMTDEQIEVMPVLEMYVLPSNYVNLIPDPDDMWGVLGYTLEANGFRFPLRKVDVIHWKMPNLNFDVTGRSHLRGLPPLTPGYKTLQQNNDATNASVRMYQNDGAKGVLFNETFDKLTPVQQSKVKNVVDAKINTNDVKGQVATLQGKWGYVNFGGTSVDLQLLEGKELSWKEMCFLLTVPYEFFDSDTTFANKEQAQKGWVSNTIIPACKQLDGELNRALLISFGLKGKAFIACDYSDLPELQKDLAQLATALSSSWWLTPNEKREEMEFEKRPEPEMDEIWPQGGSSPMSQMNDQAEMDRITQELTNRGLMNGGVDKKKSL